MLDVWEWISNFIPHIIIDVMYYSINHTRIEVKYIEAETKWPTFSRRHFQMYFLEWKYMNFIKGFEYCSLISLHREFENGWQDLLQSRRTCKLSFAEQAIECTLWVSRRSNYKTVMWDFPRMIFLYIFFIHMLCMTQILPGIFSLKWYFPCTVIFRRCSLNPLLITG